MSFPRVELHGTRGRTPRVALPGRGSETRPVTFRARLHTRLWAAGVRHSHVLVLRCPLGPAPARETGGELRDFGRDAAGVGALNDALVRGLSPVAIANRLERGLHFCALFEEARAVATTWVIPRGERFLEELGLGFALPDDGLWVRDVFVPPPERGRGRFASLLDAVRRHWPERTALWSDVRHGNTRSLRAHRGYGFEVAGRYEAVHLFSRVLVRLRGSAGLPLASDWSGGRRVALTGERYRLFARARRA